VRFIYVRKMFCEKAFELIKELHRSPDSLPLFNVRFLCIRRYPLHWLLSKGVTRNRNPNISSITGLDRHRGFQEVKVPRFRDNGT